MGKQERLDRYQESNRMYMPMALALNESRDISIHIISQDIGSVNSTFRITLSALSIMSTATIRRSKLQRDIGKI